MPDAVLAVIDGDLQHDETILPHMYRVIRDRAAQLTVRFVSQMISVTRDKNGTVVDGNPDKVADMIAACHQGPKAARVANVAVEDFAGDIPQDFTQTSDA